MRKNLFLLSLIPALLFTSCNKGESVDKSKIALEYGNIHSGYVSLLDLQEFDYDELKDAIERKETFVMMINTEIAEITGCGCWNDFYPHFVKFSNEYHYDFKLFNINYLDGKESFGIYKNATQMPGICFFKKGKLIRQTIYGRTNENNRKFFKQYEAFKNYMLENVYLPNFYYIDKGTLDKKVNNDEEFNLYVARRECGDCNQINTTYMKDWLDKNNKGTVLNDKLYIFDIQDYYPTKDDPDEKREAYQALKDELGLSVAGNSTFGYGTGVVPTFQRRKGSQIKDMISVLNDSISKVEDKFIISSYFNAVRINSSPILKNTGGTYLYDGQEIDESKVNIIEYMGKYYYLFKDNTQLDMHTPIVDLFFKAYVK